MPSDLIFFAVEFLLHLSKYKSILGLKIYPRRGNTLSGPQQPSHVVVLIRLCWHDLVLRQETWGEENPFNRP